jgi:CBS domain-containing protein
VKIKEIMTPNPIVISGTTSIAQIEKIFKKKNIWSILIGDSRKCVGIITQSDLKKRGKNKHPSTPADAIMSKGVYVIEQEEDIIKAIAIFREKNFNSLAVTNNGMLCGIITKSDIRKRYNQKIFNNDLGLKVKNHDNQLKNVFQHQQIEDQQKKSIKKDTFFIRLKNALGHSINEAYIDRLKESYRNDVITFVGLIFLSLGMLGMMLVVTIFSILMLFFRPSFIPGRELPPIDIFILLIGGSGFLTIIGFMILNGKRRQDSLNAIPNQQPDQIPNSGQYHSIHTHPFEIALSFSGCHRDLVEQVALGLATKIGKTNVFYDFFYRPHLSRLNLDLLLQKIYKNNSKLNVVFLSSDYDTKEWCGIEFRAIRELIKTKQTEKIMLLKLDDVDIEGIFSCDGYLDIRQMEPGKIVDSIIERSRGIPVEKCDLSIESFVEASDKSMIKPIPERLSTNNIDEMKKIRRDSTRSIRDITRDTRRLR